MGISPSWSALFERRMVVWVWVPIVLISVLHYSSAGGPRWLWIHDVARRLYYLPIIGAAFVHGAKCSIPSAFVVIAVYLPHAFVGYPAMDPASGIEKFLEMLLYMVVASVTGILVDRERREKKKQAELAAQLASSLKEKERMADQLIRSGRLTALGELTAGIAHEIRNPLHAMRGTAEIVGDELPSSGDIHVMWERHMAEIDRLDRVLERFLAFARPSPPTLVALDPAMILRRTATLIEAQARRDHVRVELGRVEDGTRIEGDLDLLVQVCLAIGVNAIQFMKNREGERCLRLEGRRSADDDGWYVVRLANTGPPIPSAHLERIFDPFFTTRNAGSGLGLAIAARIVDMHGGRLAAMNVGEPPHPLFEVGLPILRPGSHRS